MAGVRRDLDRKQVSRDHVFCKPFLRSVRYLNQDRAATHQTELEFFEQLNRETPGEDRFDLRNFCRYQSTNKEVYSYDKQETR